MSASAVPSAPTTFGPLFSSKPSTVSTSASALSRWRRLNIKSLDSILTSRRELESLLQLQDEDAAAVVEVLDQALLDSSDLDHDQRKTCAVALRKLCGNCGILPTSHTLTDGLEKINDYPHASGGFAEVWEGRYKGRLVAMKALRTYATDDLVKVKQRFCKEVLVWRRLSHPNVLPFLGVSTTHFRFCMVSVWMTHGNIVNYVKVHPDANRLLLLTDIANGLNYLHTENLVHGDLKGANILINNDYRACLADFGLMVVLHDSLTANSTSTAAGGGTLRWMAPELLMPEKYGLTRCRPSKESDMYAVGMVIYEVMTGNVPFCRCGTIAVTQKVLAGDRPERPTDSAMAGLSDDLWQIVELCWHQQRTKRPTINRLLSHLNKAAPFWDPPSPKAGNSALNVNYDSDASSTISTLIPAKIRVPQRPQAADNTLTTIKPPSRHVVPARDPPRTIVRENFVGQSSARPIPVRALDRTQFQVPDLPPTKASRLREGVEDVGGQISLWGAIASPRRALRQRNEKLASSLTEKGSSLVYRFRRTQELEDLEEAITCHRRALALRPPGNPNRSTSLSKLARAIHDRFEMTHKLKDLEAAIGYHREALALLPSGDPDRWRLLNNLALVIHARFKRFHKVQDLEEAILYAHEALVFCPPENNNRWSPLTILANAMNERFRTTQKLEDLEDAIVFHREALHLCPPGNPDRSISLNNLACAINKRFQRTRKSGDFEEVIAYHREALHLRPPGNPDRWVSLNNLACAIHDHFKRTRGLHDLEEAISYYREALDLRPPGNPDRPISLNNLASAIRDRFERTRRLEDLYEATKLLSDSSANAAQS